MNVFLVLIITQFDNVISVARTSCLWWTFSAKLVAYAPTLHSYAIV